MNIQNSSPSPFNPGDLPAPQSNPSIPEISPMAPRESGVFRPPNPSSPDSPAQSPATDPMWRPQST